MRRYLLVLFFVTHSSFSFASDSESSGSESLALYAATRVAAYVSIFTTLHGEDKTQIAGAALLLYLLWTGRLRFEDALIAPVGLFFHQRLALRHLD